MCISSQFNTPQSIPTLADPCPYLIDATVISFGNTCKKMHLLCRNVLQHRDECLKNIVSDYYTCTKNYQVNSLNKINIWCLGERHGSEKCGIIQAKLINCLSIRWPTILLLESLPSLKSFTHAELENVCQPIQLIARNLKPSKNIHYLGWDDETSVAEIRDAKMSFEQNFKERAEELKTELRALTTEINTIIKKCTLCQSEVDMMALKLGIEKTGNDFESPDAYLSHIKGVLKETHLDEQKEIQDLINKISSIEQDSRLFEKMDRHQNLNNFVKTLPAIYESEIGDYEEAVLINLLERTFPLRTEKMIMTLSKIDEYVLENPELKDAKIVLISGMAHLAMKKSHSHIPSFNLDLFYEEIKKHQAAIFIPTEFLEEYA